jgi:hypothetical protein
MEKPGQIGRAFLLSQATADLRWLAISLLDERYLAMRRLASASAIDWNTASSSLAAFTSKNILELVAQDLSKAAFPSITRTGAVVDGRLGRDGLVGLIVPRLGIVAIGQDENHLVEFRIGRGGLVEGNR